MPTVSIGDCIGWCGLALIAVQTVILGWAYVAFVLVLGVTTACAAREIAYRASERQERARLLAEAEAQHGAWLAGDDDWGVYGISPIATTEPEPLLQGTSLATGLAEFAAGRRISSDWMFADEGRR